jgi:PKHD-type hydroxylase
MGYRDHLDSPHMGEMQVRTDISVTIALSDADAYTGGELVIDCDGLGQRWKGNAGDALVYSSDTVHRVEPVTRGARLAAIFWIESLVRDPTKRQILFDLADAFDGLAPDARCARQAAALRRCHGDLLRLWAGQPP